MTATRRKPLSRPLPGRVQRFSDEPHYALLLRTAEHNGVFQPYTTFWRAGLTRGQNVADLSVEKVAFLCQQDATELAPAAPVVTTAEVKIGGQTLYRDQVSVERRRWCPACMDEQPYHRVWWDVMALAACPDHGLMLAERCGCARRPLWRSSPLTKCSRGHRYAAVDAAVAPADEVAFSAYVRARLCGRDRTPVPLLDELDLGEAVRVVQRIGRASLDEDRRFVRVQTGRDGLAAEGFRIAQDFAPRIDEVFDRLLAQSKARKGVRQWGAEHAYGDFYIWIANYPAGSQFAAAIKQAVASHAEQNIVIKTGHKVAGVEVAQPEGVDMTTAAEMWGVTFERFRRLATTIGIIPKSSLRGRPARLDPETVDLWADRIRNAKTRQEVAAELKIAPAQVARLIKDGLLRAVVDGKTDKQNRLNIWLLPLGAGAALVARLAAVATPMEERGKLLPISIIARMVRAPLAKLIRLALAGELPVYQDPSASGLMAFLVRQGDAQVTVRRKRVPGLTITEAGVALGLHADTMAQLRWRGMLKAVRYGRIHSVAPEEFERLKATYVETGEIATMLGLTAGGRGVIKTLRDRGVAPVCDRPEFRQVLFRRDEVVRALSRPAAAPAKPPIAAGSVDAKTFARTVGIDPQMVPQIVEVGIVEPLVAGHRYVFAAETVAAFKRRYATGSEFAPQVGVNGRGVLAILKKMGVAPIYDRPQVYSALYPRAEAEAAIARYLAEEAKKAEEARMAKSSTEPLFKSRDAYKRLGCSDLMLTQMRRTGALIKASRDGAKYVYRESELERFRHRYVFGNELDVMIGRRGDDGGGSMTRVVIGLGVKPVCAPPAFYSYLFERAEVMEALKRWNGVTNKRTSRVAEGRSWRDLGYAGALGEGKNVGRS